MAAELSVLSLVDHAHAARAKLAENDVVEHIAAGS
jgi:hypothetical protein